MDSISIEFDLTIDSMYSILCDLAEKYTDFSHKRIFFRNKTIFLFYIFIICVRVCVCGKSSLYLVKKFQFNILWKWERRGFKF